MGLKIRNTENVQHKVVGISLPRRDQFKADVAWSVLGNVINNNAEFVLTIPLEVHLDHVEMPVGNGRILRRLKSSLWTFLSSLKRRINVVKAALLWLTH